VQIPVQSQLMNVKGLEVKLPPSGQKPPQSQQNNVRGKANWHLLRRYFADFEEAFASWEVGKKLFKVNEITLG